MGNGTGEMRLGFSPVGVVGGRFDLAINALDHRIESYGQQRGARSLAGHGPGRRASGGVYLPHRSAARKRKVLGRRRLRARSVSLEFFFTEQF
jgi:hypothetical protein